MESRFHELFRLQTKLYMEGSPVIIEAGAIQKDTVTDKVLVQLKIRNLSSCNVIACKVCIWAYEPSGKELEGVVDFSYLDINISRGNSFGSKVPIYLPNKSARKIAVAVTEVVFEDNTIWTGELRQWNQLPEQRTIVEQFKDKEIVKQYEIEEGKDGIYYPEIKYGLFFCTCGNINFAKEKYCYKCNRKYDALMGNTNIEYLITQKDERLKKEQEERENAIRVAEELKLRKELKVKKIKKVFKSLLPVIAVIVIVVALTPKVIKPAIQNAISYHNALELLNSGEYDAATEAFKILGEYRDADKKALESQYKKAEKLDTDGNYKDAIDIWTSIEEYSDSKLKIQDAEIAWKEEDYQNALALMESKKYIEASKAFDALNEYKDSVSKSIECTELKKEQDYQTALEFVDNNKYSDAISRFLLLGEYKDSKTLYISTAYIYACELMQKGEYSHAVHYFEIAQGYKDADELRIRATYDYACALLDEGDYKSAVTQFKKCNSYKESNTKILDAEYRYISEHQDCSDETTFSYLKELIEVQYSGAQKLYNQLYKWKAVVIINDGDSYVKWNEYTDVTIKISGGEPGKSNKICAKVTYPTGEINNSIIGWEEVKNGDKTGFYWQNGVMQEAYSGLLTVNVYDEKNNLLGTSSIKVKK